MQAQKMVLIVIGVFAALLPGAPAIAALNWDGQSGVFLNTLAYPASPSSVEVSSHTADLGDLGSVSTYNVGFGLQNNIEIGLTRYSSNVTGVQDQNLILGKWQFLGETPKNPAIAAWFIRRDLVGGEDTIDLGMSATKIATIGKYPLVLDLGARSTKALGLGLFGIGNKREIKFEGSAALFVTKKFVVGTEFKQQINAQSWKDIAFRYIASDSLNIDAGIADFGPGLANQIALAVTYKH